jgi:hypothetical protein
MPGRSTLNGQSFILRLGQLLARQTGQRFHDGSQVCKITEPHWDAGEAIKMDAQRLAMLPRTVKNIQRAAAKRYQICIQRKEISNGMNKD